MPQRKLTSSMHCQHYHIYPQFNVRVFSSVSSVIKVRQCLTEEFVSFQSMIAEAAIQNNDPPAAKRHHKDVGRPSQEQSSLWPSFDSMIQTGDETNTALSESLCTAEVQIESYLKEPNQPRHSNHIIYWQEKKIFYPVLAQLAAKYLSIPAASVASDRLFSRYSQTHYQ